MRDGKFLTGRRATATGGGRVVGKALGRGPAELSRGSGRRG
jgi:hypothetical protein